MRPWHVNILRPTDSATVAVAAVLNVSLSLDKGDPASSKDPASSEDFASSDSDVALNFTDPGGRASQTDFWTAVAAALIVQFVPVQENSTSKTLQVRILTCAVFSRTLEAELHQRALRLL